MLDAHGEKEEACYNERRFMSRASCLLILFTLMERHELTFPLPLSLVVHFEYGSATTYPLSSRDEETGETEERVHSEEEETRAK